MDSEKIDYLIINRKHFSTCQASRILVGFSDVLLRELVFDNPWAERGIGCSTTGLTYTMTRIQELREDFCRWFPMGRNYATYLELG